MKPFLFLFLVCVFPLIASEPVASLGDDICIIDNKSSNDFMIYMYSEDYSEILSTFYLKPGEVGYYQRKVFHPYCVDLSTSWGFGLFPEDGIKYTALYNGSEFYQTGIFKDDSGFLSSGFSFGILLAGTMLCLWISSLLKKPVLES